MWCTALLCMFLCPTKTASAVQMLAKLISGFDGSALATIARNCDNSVAVEAHSLVNLLKKNEAKFWGWSWHNTEGTGFFWQWVKHCLSWSCNMCLTTLSWIYIWMQDHLDYFFYIFLCKGFLEYLKNLWNYNSIIASNIKHKLQIWNGLGTFFY